MDNNLNKQYTINELERILNNIDETLDKIYNSYNKFNEGYSDAPSIKINEAFSSLEDKLLKARKMVIDMMNDIVGGN